MTEVFVMVNRKFSPYQLVHMTKILDNNLNSLLVCDGVGVGKTISSGYALWYFSEIEKLPSLIVCPPILIEKWRFELKHRFGLNTILATTKDEFELMREELDYSGNKSSSIYITSYSLLSREKELSPARLGLTLFDEVHYLRNPETQAYASAKKIASNSEYKLGLSATPINNSISDLASIISILMPQIEFHAADDFLNDYWNSSSLNDDLSSFITRFDKEQISEHFTKRHIETVNIQFQEDYMIWVNQEVEKISLRKGHDSLLSKIVYYRMAASSPSAFCKSVSAVPPSGDFNDSKSQKLLELLSTKSNERWLVFTEFKETAKHLEKVIEDRLVLTLSGDSSKEEREAYTNIFLNDENSVMIMTPVGSEGLDFQICSNLINFDLHWNPMKIEQRIGRIDRIGQKNDTIHIYNFLVKGSIDENILQTITSKMNIIEGSFAEIMPIIEKGWDGSFMGDQDVINHELMKASELQRSLDLLTTFRGLDLDVINRIEEGNCDIAKWSENDWSAGVPWREDCQDWSTMVRSNSKKLKLNLNAYNQS